MVKSADIEDALVPTDQPQEWDVRPASRIDQAELMKDG